MLSGDPYRFAILCDKVDSWSDDFYPHFHNGCFGYFIGGQLIWSLRSTLGDDIGSLEISHCMKHSVEDERIFNLPAHDAYRDLCSRAFPSVDSDAEDSDFRYLVSVNSSLSDEGWNVFLVEHAEEAKLIYGFNQNADKVNEVILRRGEFQQVAREAIEKFRILFPIKL